MSEPILIAVCAVAVFALLRVSISYARYRAVHRFGEDDIAAARRDAARRSRGVRGGKAAEHLAPLLGEFAERFDLADARFVGAPIDFVVFDGLAEGDLREIVLVEVKTGTGRLNASELQVRDAVERGAVDYRMIRLS